MELPEVSTFIFNYLPMFKGLDATLPWKETVLILMCLVAMFTLTIIIEGYYWKTLPEELKNFLEKKTVTKRESDYDELENCTLFKEVFAKKFDKILKLNNSSMLNYQNKIKYNFVNELHLVVDLDAYQKKCLKNYEDSNPRWYTRYWKSTKQTFRMIGIEISNGLSTLCQSIYYNLIINEFY